MIRRPPRSTRTDTLFPTRRSSDLLPYQDLSIMEACLKTGVHYMDTANYEPRDEAKFEYHWQWAYHDRFKDAGLMALLGSGFDPGVTSVFATYLKKHYQIGRAHV